LIAPLNAFGPNTLDPGPSRISMRATEFKSIGKLRLWWPVCGSEIFTPFIRIKFWSKEPPRTLISDWIPFTPRCLTSTPEKFLSNSFMSETGRSFISSLLITVTCLDNWEYTTGAFWALTIISSKSKFLVTIVSVWLNAFAGINNIEYVIHKVVILITFLNELKTE